MPNPRKIIQLCDETVLVGGFRQLCDRRIDPVTGYCDNPRDHITVDGQDIDEDDDLLDDGGRLPEDWL